MLIPHKIATDLKHNWLIIAILCVGMLPFALNGYSMYLLVLLFPLALRFKYWDIWSLLIFVFGIIYTSSILLGGETLVPSKKIFYGVYPIMMYQVGKCIVHKFKYLHNISFVITLVIVCLGLQTIVANVSDAINSGELIQISRHVEVDESGDYRSATGYGMMLSILLGCTGLVMIPARHKIDRLIKWILVIGAFFAIFCTIHLLNRTGLVLVAVSLFITLCLPPHSVKRTAYIFVVLLIITAIFYAFFSESKFLVEAIDGYSARNRGIGRVDSASGRDIRWLAGIQQLWNQPLGGMKGVRLGHSLTYAHNLIIDGGIKGGIISSIILIALFIRLFICNLKLYKQRRINQFERVFYVLVSVAIFLQCMTEPIIEGLPPYFWIFLLLLGVLNGLTGYGSTNTTNSRKTSSIELN